MRGALSPPSMVESLRYIRPRMELTQKQSFRAPIDDLESNGMENPNDPSHLYGYRPQLVAPPGYAMPPAHTDFYLHAGPYAATHPPPPQAPMAAYSMAGSIPAQPAPNPYLPAPTAAAAAATAPTHHLPPKHDEYPQPFRAPYGPATTTAFEPLGHNPLASSVPPALNTAAMPGSLGDRSRSQSEQSPTAYRNPSISSRSVATDATSPLDPSTPASYSRGSFSLASQMETPHQSMEPRGMAAFDPSVPRRESLPASYYARNDRHPYYMGATAPSAHASYPAQPMSTWTTAAPAQPQI